MMTKKKHSVRYSNETSEKQAGEIFTPASLADFVARRLLNFSDVGTCRTIKILEPSVGDGALLLALLRNLKAQSKKIEVTAYDINVQSISETQSKVLTEFPDVEAKYLVDDFLSNYSGGEEADDLFVRFNCKEKFDFIISNPPYVRTQILGAQKATEIARKFQLSGRVDLYQPFLITMISMLKEGGSLGVITSNRFLTTKSGASTRSFLGSNLHLNEIWDLGDTKLFDAAVLPSLIFGRKSSSKERNTPLFNSIYETSAQQSDNKFDLFDALWNESITDFEARNGKVYEITRGNLSISEQNAGNSWTISNLEKNSWFETVESKTAFTFGDVAAIKVGVKTTADKVFLNKNWDELGDSKPELLFPLLTRKNATRYKHPNFEHGEKLREILYPYDCNLNSRLPIDISKFPKTNEYLEANRATLEARKYIIDAGRKWYAIHVPQNPSNWKKKKLVFPDISEKPMFWLDTTGSIVSGECYWIILKENVDEELLYLMLGVANSTFIEKFYDNSFHNKLYSGKRRFISQYVERFPLPNPKLKKTKEIIYLVKDMLAEEKTEAISALEMKIDGLVTKSFGL